MNKEQSNNNPWAEKLDQVSLPELQQAKQQLFSQLDSEMPPAKNNNRRLWLFVLLLLLLIGVCNCPGIRNSISSKNEAILNDESTKIKPLDKSDNTIVIQMKNKNTISDKVTTDNNTDKAPVTSSEKKQRKKTSHFDSNLSQFAVPPANTPVNEHQSVHKKMKPVTKNISTVNGRNDNYSKSSYKKNKSNYNNRFSVKRANKKIFKNDNIVDNSKNNTVIIEDSTSFDNRQSMSDKVPDANTALVSNADSVKVSAIDSIKVDSVSKSAATDTVKKENKATNKNKWAVSIGFNQFVAIPNQHYSSANANGKNNFIDDYIPVPQLRYRLNDKWFVQAEVAFNSPQYSPELPIGIRTDSALFGQRIYLRKLYYLRIPVSFYYRPVKQMYAGGGLQLAALTNAAAFSRDSIVATPLKNFSSNTTYQVINKNEIAVFVDLGYQWNNLSAGARYNQALNSFINTAVPGIGNVKATNHSLQLYIRYTLWKSKSMKKSTGK
jgi:Outer membrane protein beta-barrel domain